MNRYYRKARIEDLDQIMEAVEDSREVLRLQGNGQWQDGYPNKDDFINDINNGRLFITFDEDPNEIIGVCALTYREEDYHHLYEGKWLTNYPYMVMHRVAIKKKYKGRGYGKKLFELFVEQAKVEGYRSLRIDTHAGNAVMRHLIESFGFVYCGKAILTPNKDRLVYEKVLTENELLKPIIECDRFFLREYRESDYADLSEIYQDSVNMKYFGAPYDDKMMRRLIDWTLDNYQKYGFGFWAIIDKKSGDFIGDCGLSMQNIDGEWLPEIGYHIKLKYHNMGYASEAAQLVKQYIFKNYHFNALFGYTTKDNIPSIKVMMKNGMSFVKEFSKDDEIYVVYSVKR